jgi:acyl-CoA synthetase
MIQDWQPRAIAPELERRYVREGFWTDQNLGQILAEGMCEGAGNDFAIHSQMRPWTGTIGDVYALARRVAQGLRDRGVSAGDLVAFQLPNWLEAAATFYAVSFLGAVPVPIVHFYGPKEVGFILRQSGARTLVTADSFGSLDFLGNLESIRGDLPALEQVIVVGRTPEGMVPFHDVADATPLDAPAPVDPSTPALIAYTSGTTSDPKGVVHSHRTIVAEIKQLGAVDAAGGLPSLGGAPVGHGIGMLAALLLPIQRREPVNLIDVWDPQRVLQVMLERGLVGGTGATYFLTSLLDHPDITPEHLALMSKVGLGGSAVPAAVTDRATSLGISVVRLYGSTEHPSITGCTHHDPLDKRLYTDGKLLPGVEVRLLDDDGGEVGPGTAGEIHSRGPDCFIGYTDQALTASMFDSDGWYRTEDVGALDPDGYLSITDRKKDIIIRGGENISAAEVEEQLLRIPGVAEVAVVAAPDDRLGERACAVIRLLPETPAPDLETVREQLRGAGLAKQKWPEELRFVPDFPRTASGKVQKFALRDELRREATAPRPA